jgi:dTMP kinase
MARDIVRGADREWVRSLYGIALIPDMVIYLKVSPNLLVERNLCKNSTLDYWESGRDLGLSRDSFDSFIRYQRLIQKEFTLFQENYGFTTVNGNLSVRSVAGEICRRVVALPGVYNS